MSAVPTQIVIFAKAPVPGSVKTRLIPVLGAVGAAELAKQMLSYTFAHALAAGLAIPELCATPPPDDAAWVGHLPAGVWLSVPKGRTSAEAYLQAVRPQLRFEGRTAEVAEAVLKTDPPSPGLTPARDLLMLAGADLLPTWAAKMHGLSISAAQRPGIRIGIKATRKAIRWALGT